MRLTSLCGLLEGLEIWGKGLELMSRGTEEEAGEIFATKVRGVVKWFNVKGGYCFINRNDTNGGRVRPPDHHR